MRKETFNVTGMTCSACAARVERAVKKMEGTADVSVNLLTNTMTLAYDAATPSPPRGSCLLSEVDSSWSRVGLVDELTR